ncbi:Bloom syndrome protein homolog isoform X2 [Anoplophora glabripennis]|nr:Bloom syndrome protein homolog isoform X2 [Anoplophora glabripennis]
MEQRDSTEDLLQDISNIDWNENVFSEINTTLVSRDHSAEFKANYPFSEEMLDILHTKFGLENFRPGQREIINAILNGHDCFILMPTGGGKSLCYQLPAVLSKGVTIVISPLIALIGDQVDKLNALDIRTAHLCSTNSRQETEEVLSKLYLSEPEIDLLYLTPEKTMVSDETRDMINSLYKRGKLSRFVIDEVHCLSLWGHDFRPHYKQLSMLREKYTDIQIICFTATATKQVETDVIVNLNLWNVKKFIQSFNRPNIKYQIIDKHDRMPVYEIAQLINKKFFRKSGIIYCLARKDCVNLSSYLRHLGITAKPYHAGLETEVREQTQKEWMQDQFHVIVATIAFGMGIDKPDVRFVIHNTIPKSLEAYYQETGRAGRDGEVSYSYLFYSYEDVIRTMRLMKKGFSNRDTLDGHFDNLEQMVAFANNQIDCRRYLQLLNLGENFDRQLCMENRATMCDNCENFNNSIENQIDITKQAKELAILVRDISEKTKITLIMAVKIYKGSREKNIRNKGLNNHKYYGSGRLLSRLDVHRILRDLIARNVLANDYITTGDFPLVYIKSGRELQSFIDSSDVKMSIPVANGRSIQTECMETEYSISVAVDSTLLPSAAAVQHLTKRIQHQCYVNLLDLCHRLALEKNVSVSAILHPSAIKCISEVLPKNREELLKIQHVTTAIFDKYGLYILRSTNHFWGKLQFLKGEAVTDPQTLNWDPRRSDSSPVKRTFTEAFSDNNR